MNEIPTLEQQVESALNSLIEGFSLEKNKTCVESMSIKIGLEYVQHDYINYARMDFKIYNKVFQFKRYYGIGSTIIPHYQENIITMLVREFKTCLGYLDKYITMPFYKLPLIMGLEDIPTGHYKDFVRSLILHRLASGA